LLCAGKDIYMYTLLCAGKDIYMYTLLCAGKDNNQKELLKQTRIYVNHFAKDGLRTLCMAKKVSSYSKSLL